MKTLRVAMIALAIVQVVLTGFTSLVGGFADGGSVWERALIMVVHPVAAIALLVMVLTLRTAAKWLTRVAVVLLLVSIAGDVAVYVAISEGTIKGDKSLALIFAIIPVIGVVYGLARGTGRGQVNSPGATR